MDATQFSIPRLFDQQILLFFALRWFHSYTALIGKTRFKARKMNDPGPLESDGRSGALEVGSWWNLEIAYMHKLQVKLFRKTTNA